MAIKRYDTTTARYFYTWIATNIFAPPFPLCLLTAHTSLLLKYLTLENFEVKFLIVHIVRGVRRLSWWWWLGDGVDVALFIFCCYCSAIFVAIIVVWVLYKMWHVFPLGCILCCLVLYIYLLFIFKIWELHYLSCFWGNLFLFKLFLYYLYTNCKCFSLIIYFDNNLKCMRFIY